MEDAPPRPPLNSLASADAGIPEDDNVVENIVLDPSPDAHQASPRSLGAVAGSLSEEEETDDDSSNFIADIEYNELGSFSIERVFVCQGGVNTVRLLQLTRKSLLEEGQMVGANALVNEMWSCEVFQRSREVYEVRIRYGASIAKAYRNPPSEPVAVKEAKGIPGLMTILEASNA
ncbi:SubName: Full=Uncharacterized protein {ECO:0000313/EMBL:CCA74321.1} [Serendipita indica DSM 11827]|nr:SubName: Full=Uncharacterized protein {ECO:0000313/EMBL:CCA74321.1} [Serendipita indica DSM 11827]